MKRCAFCPTEATKLSGEHIWDDWLNRALPTKRFKVRQKWSRLDPFREYDARIIKEKLPVVCEECNNTWMSDLTNRTKQAFSEMIVNGTPTTLQPKDIDLLAAFTFMKAVVADHATVKDDPFFVADVREQFRGSCSVPSNAQMWIAAYQGVHRYSGRFVTNVLTPDKPGPLYGVEFYSFTYVVGRVVLQLLAARWKDIRYKGYPLPVLSPNAYWSPAVIKFWPNTDAPISWPPSKWVGDDVIEKFIERFNAPINLRIA